MRWQAAKGLSAILPSRRYGYTAILGGRHDLLRLFALGVVAIAVGKGIVDFGNRYAMEFIAQRVIYDLRNELHAQLQRLSFSFYDKAQTGCPVRS